MQIEQWNTVNSLDFKEIKKKLKASKSYFWKIRKNIDRIEAEYKQFLYLITVNPKETIVPWSQDVDDFWHQHILDTLKYARDCEDICGRFIHHNPHLPLGTTEHNKASKKTEILYKESFGKLKDKKENSNSNCGSSCSSTSYMPIVFCSSCSSHSHSDSHSCDSSSDSSDSGSSCGGSSCSSCSGGGD